MIKSEALPIDIAANFPVLKGFVFSEEDPEHQIVVQVVGKRVDIARGDRWAGRTPETRLVAIGAPGAVCEDMLEAIFLETA